MDVDQFDEILFKLRNFLTDENRRKLYFLLHDDPIEHSHDDSSSIDRQRINEEKFHVLINTLEQWQCTDAVKLLNEYWENHHSFEYLSNILVTLTNESTVYVENDIRANATIEKMNLNDQEKKHPSALTRIFCNKYILFLVLCVIVGYGILLGFSIKTFINNSHARVSYTRSMKIIRQLMSQLRKLEKIGTPPYPHPRWQKNATTVAGGNGKGLRDDQLQHFYDIFVDNEQTVYIADSNNHRVVAWKRGATLGKVVAGGNGAGAQSYQLNYPTSVIVDHGTADLLICDQNNWRIVQWPSQHFVQSSSKQFVNEGQVIISNVACFLLTMDDSGYLYVSDLKSNAIRRYGKGDRLGTVVAGWFKRGQKSNEFDAPTHIFVDTQSNLYVSDSNNDRVVKWLNGSTTGVIVAGGNEEGMHLSQLSSPAGLWINAYGDIYVVDRLNNRIMRWDRGARLGTVIVGDKGIGSSSYQLNDPHALFFDRDGQLYVGDSQNFRVQRFSIQ